MKNAYEPFPIEEISFLPEDDYEYLRDSEKFIRNVANQLNLGEFQDIYLQKLREFIQQLESTQQLEKEIKQQELKVLAEKISSHHLGSTYFSDVEIPPMNFKLHMNIEAGFVSAFFRHLFLSEQHMLSQERQNEEREKFRARIENDFTFLKNEINHSKELTSLYRFYRTIVFASKYVRANRNKGLLVTVGSILEGNDDSTRYESKEQAHQANQSRIFVFEELYLVTNRKRKSVSESSNEKPLNNTQFSLKNNSFFMPESSQDQNCPSIEEEQKAAYNGELDRAI